MPTKIADMVHPEYLLSVEDWEQWRLCYEGGTPFLNEYLMKFSVREDNTDYLNRKAITPIAHFAAAGIDDIKNAIFQRLPEVKRLEGSNTYQAAIAGRMGGLTQNNRSMANFIGEDILPELLPMGKVGIYVDMPKKEALSTSRLDADKQHPYLYAYKTEDIRSWVYSTIDEQPIFTKLLLRDYKYTLNVETGLPEETEAWFRFYKLEDGVVKVQYYDSNSIAINDEIILDLNRIPFIILELNHGLMKNIAVHQIAALNLGSSDINYAFKSNFPFYTEQYDLISEMSHLRPGGREEGDDTTDEVSNEQVGDIAKKLNTKTGVTQGRRYPLGADRPGFIAPPTDPLMASMQKQEQLKDDIRRLLALALSNMQPKLTSSDAKNTDERGLESGLSYIGLELQRGEQQIAEIWTLYERQGEPATISYPSSYSLKTDQDRRKEAKEMSEMIPKLPSQTYKKATAKDIAAILLKTKVTDEELDQIYSEIDNAPIIETDPNILKSDLEAGFVSAETGSLARGYPKGEAAKAEDDHAKRAARIIDAQRGAGARGGDDMDADPIVSARAEKQVSQDPTLDVDSKSKTRGDGKNANS